MSNSIQRIIGSLARELRQFLNGPTMHPALAGVPSAFREDHSARGSSFDGLLDVLRDGFLRAVPTKRRTAERRAWRRIGMPQFQAKRRHDLKCCVECGHMHEAHTLCGHCYSKIRVEAEAIQKAMVESFGWTPIEQDVVVKYKGEAAQPEESGKRIIEMEKPRPKFFSDNLIQKGNHSPK